MRSFSKSKREREDGTNQKIPKKMQDQVSERVVGWSLINSGLNVGDLPTNPLLPPSL